MPLDLGVGVSSQLDIYLAGQESARLAVDRLGGAFPDLVLVFSSIRYADPRLLKGVGSMTANCPLVGGTGAGVIGTSGPERRSVVVIALKARGGRFKTGVGFHSTKNPKGAGEQLAQALQDQKDPNALLIFPDGLETNSSEIMKGFEKKFGRSLPVAGGGVADDFVFQKTFQYFNDEVLIDSVPGVLFCGDVKLGIGVQHGWGPLGKPHRVTKSSGHWIQQLDRRPAVAFYEDYLGITKEAFREEVLAHWTMTYPIGAEAPDGSSYVLRHALRAGPGGSLFCNAEVAQGSWVRLMMGGAEAALEAAQSAAIQAVKQVGVDRLKGALIFSSAARQKMFGTGYPGEIDVIRGVLGGKGVCMGGFYTYGEIAFPGAPAKKWVNKVHNESVVVIALG